MKTEIDLLVMLLSSDWFFDYWSLIDLDADPARRKRLQLDCRKLVDQILSGIPQGEDREYWLTDVSEERLSRTYDLFFQAVEDSKIGAGFAATAKLILTGPVASEKDRSAAWFLGGITEELVNGSASVNQEHLSPKIVQRVVEVWNGFKPVKINLKRLELASDTDWDRYLRTVLPDRPKYSPPSARAILAVHASVGIIKPMAFLRLWEAIAKVLSSSERSAVAEWYISTASKRSHGTFNPPAWLK